MATKATETKTKTIKAVDEVVKEASFVKPAKKKEIDRSRIAFSTIGGHKRTVEYIDKDIKDGNYKTVKYSPGLSEILGEIYDFKFNGVSIRLQIDGKDNFVPAVLHQIIVNKIDRILELNSPGRGQMDVGENRF